MNNKKQQGLSLQQVELSRKTYGENVLTQKKLDSFWVKFAKGLTEPMIIILLVALAIQIILFIMGETHWFEPLGILFTIIIANSVSAYSEKKQEGKASALKNAEELKEISKVIREGVLKEIHVSEIVVGDIVYLQSGDKLPADGEIIHGEIKVDQASLNGETEEALKKPVDNENSTYNVKDLLNEHYAYRGTVVCSGEAYLEVKVVGDKSLFGQLALEVQENTRRTPLQVKLAKLAKQISTFGYVGATCIVAAILIKFVITEGHPEDFYSWFTLIINAITVAVTIIICAVPEGLPMLTSMLLSFQSMKMTKDNVLVRKINGLETAGSLSLLYTDKTGTITEGRLSVVELLLGSNDKFDNIKDLPDFHKELLVIGAGINNSSSVSDGKVIGGNSTDRALMNMLLEANLDKQIDKSNVVFFEPFDSAKKYSSVTVKGEYKKEEVQYVYIKGAPERIIENCSAYYDKEGKVVEIENKDYLYKYLDEQAARSMRLLGVARKINNSNELVLVALFCIRDNVRDEAVDAIKEVKNAGIQVVMITGDRKETAVAIAKESGLLENDDEIALTSEELAALSDDEVKAIIPKLRVVSRALPTDKSRLVKLSQELNLVVGMTGDGVNDSPALKRADVGFAMGSGTEVAKEAGDITILDDNFQSIGKAILYGRTMFKSIRKFLIFQLTVNIAAVLICFIGPLLGINIVLTVTQLLMVNIVMDSLAAIAFGTEPALKQYMREKPISRTANIVTGQMFTQVVYGGLYLTLVCLAILFIDSVSNIVLGAKEFIGENAEASRIEYLRTCVFAVFMMTITFNGFNVRTNSLNLLTGIGRNKNFLLIMAMIFALQFVFITFGGKMFSVVPLSIESWISCILISLSIIPFDYVRRIVTYVKERGTFR